MTDATPSSSDLKQSLSALHSALAELPRVDEGAQQGLREVLGDIERLLGRSAGAAQPASVTPNSAAHRLEALAVGFEARHPTLASSLREFAELLGSAGI